VVKKILQNLFKNKSKFKEEEYKSKILPKIREFREILKSKKTISFLHYGHLGDIVNSLPVIKELSKDKKCILYIQKEKPIPKHVISKDHPFGSVYLSENSILKMLPLLKKQKYFEKVEIYENQNIDIDLNFFRNLPINFNIDSVRWYFHLTGCFPDLSTNYLEVEHHFKFKDYLVIMRSLRRQNHLELAMIIKNSKLFIGNLSFGYALAEALKVPRLLESGPNFPLVYPNGNHAYDFYFQNHFEDLVKKLYFIK